MSRATIFQIAVVAAVVGLFLLLAGSVTTPADPEPVRTWRPATELEQRERDRQLLEDEMRRAWDERHR